MSICNKPCTFIVINNQNVCTTYQLGKIHKFHFVSSLNKIHISIGIVHVDVWKPAPFLALNVYHWYVLFMDEFSRFSWIYFIRDKGLVK